MKTILILLALSSALHAREMTFAWDPQNTQGFTLYVREDGGAWLSKGDILATEFKAEFPDGEFEVTVSAWNMIGEGETASRLESDKAAPLLVPTTPPVPEGLRIKITIDLETSDNLDEWRNVASISFPEQAAPKQFFRIK